MNPPRVTLSTMVVLVAVVAVNLAVARALYEQVGEDLQGFFPMGLALQLGAFRLHRTRDTFWAGFMAFGFLTAGSLVLALVSERLGPFQAMQAFMSAWNSYAETADSLLRYFTGAYWTKVRDNPVVVSAVFNVPQFALALVGGLLARWFLTRPAPEGPTAPGDVQP